MGYSRIWFGGEYIGSKEDLIYLKSYLFNGLKNIGNSEKLDFNLTENTIEEKYAFLETRLNDIENNTQNFLISFGTLSDDYIIFSYLDTDDCISIIWKLLGNHSDFEDINYTDKEVKFFRISKKEYLKELSFFEHIILKV